MCRTGGRGERCWRTRGSGEAARSRLDVAPERPSARAALPSPSQTTDSARREPHRALTPPLWRMAGRMAGRDRFRSTRPVRHCRWLRQGATGWIWPGAAARSAGRSGGWRRACTRRDGSWRVDGVSSDSCCSTRRGGAQRAVRALPIGANCTVPSDASIPGVIMFVFQRIATHRAARAIPTGPVAPSKSRGLLLTPRHRSAWGVQTGRRAQRGRRDGCQGRRGAGGRGWC